MKVEKIIIAGAGGQGIMLLGKVLAETAVVDNKFVTWLPSYGAEVRGGTAHCMVIISDEEIGSPYIDKADTLIIMNDPSLLKFQERLKKGGLLVFNEGFRFTNAAAKLGNTKVANMVALGYFLNHKKVIKLESVLEAIEKLAPKGRQDLVAINKKALMEGIKLK